LAHDAHYSLFMGLNLTPLLFVALVSGRSKIPLLFGFLRKLPESLVQGRDPPEDYGPYSLMFDFNLFSQFRYFLRGSTLGLTIYVKGLQVFSGLPVDTYHAHPPITATWLSFLTPFGTLCLSFLLTFFQPVWFLSPPFFLLLLLLIQMQYTVNLGNFLLCGIVHEEDPPECVYLRWSYLYRKSSFFSISKTLGRVSFSVGPVSFRALDYARSDGKLPHDPIVAGRPSPVMVVLSIPFDGKTPEIFLVRESPGSGTSLARTRPFSAPRPSG